MNSQTFYVIGFNEEIAKKEKALKEEAETMSNNSNNNTKCMLPCDHGSPCILAKNHIPTDRHETEHKCIFFDKRVESFPNNPSLVTDSED